MEENMQKIKIRNSFYSSLIFISILSFPHSTFCQRAYDYLGQNINKVFTAYGKPQSILENQALYTNNSNPSMPSITTFFFNKKDKSINKILVSTSCKAKSEEKSKWGLIVEALVKLDGFLPKDLDVNNCSGMLTKNDIKAKITLYSESLSFVLTEFTKEITPSQKEGSSQNSNVTQAFKADEESINNIIQEINRFIEYIEMKSEDAISRAINDHGGMKELWGSHGGGFSYDKDKVDYHFYYGSTASISCRLTIEAKSKNEAKYFYSKTIEAVKSLGYVLSKNDPIVKGASELTTLKMENVAIRLSIRNNLKNKTIYYYEISVWKK